MSINFKATRAVRQQPKHVKTQWKITSTGKAALSYYGLKITVFENSRGAWSIAVVQNGGTPEYYNFQNENAARTAAETRFHELKKSGKFTREPSPSCRQVLDGALQNGHLPPEFSEQYLEVLVRREHDAEKADLFYFIEEKEYNWVPVSQYIVGRKQNNGWLIIIIPRWLYDCRQPVLC